VANGVTEECWLRQLLLELHTPLSQAALVYCDNVSAVYLSTNSVQHQCTKHVEIDLHFVCKRVAIGDVHVPTTSQFADIFTKWDAFLDVFGVSIQSQHLSWLEFRLRGGRGERLGCIVLGCVCFGLCIGMLTWRPAYGLY
jgi:hypothetical protein